ncbi:MAG: hypothetical protein DRH06_06240 [Deltaproteobacteria bacterium]|nr:MAG: hypothetical protein DRH06_06240 [Deltaproteobacteria bacterium]
MSVVSVKNKYEGQLLSIPGVVGVFADVGRNRLVVLVENATDCQRLPAMIEGYAVECRVSGRASAL